MIINATMGTGFGGTLLYIYKDGKDLKENEKPIIIEKNHVVGSPKQMARQMAEHAQNSRRLRKPVLHLSVSFAPEDKLTQEKEIECIKASMQHLGISEEKNQYVIVKHNDSNNTHYHIVTNKLNLENKSLNTDWYKNDCVVTADKIEQEYNLTRTQGRKIIYNTEKKEREYVPKEERIKNIETKQTKVFKDKAPKICEYKTKIQSGIIEVLADKSIKTKEDFKAALKSRNIQVKLVENNNEIKGSDVGYRWADILEKLEQNKELDQPKKVETTAIKPITDFDFVIRAGGKLYGLIEYSNDYKHLKLQTEEGKIAQTENNRNFNFVKHPKRETNNIELDLLNKGKSLLQKGKTPYKLEKSKETGKVLFLSLTEKECYAKRSILGVSGDVFITQNQNIDYEDKSIADTDKKKKSIKR
jgi:hypothetical protein